MSHLLTLKFLALLAMVGVAVVTDLRDRRIPNWLTVSGAATALVLSAVEVGGFPTAALVGLVVALGLMIPLFALGAFGAGDVKLLAAVGAFVGASGLPSVVVYGTFLGGVIGILMSIRRGVILPVLIQTTGVFLYLVTLGRRGARRTIHDADAQTIPYGVAIAAGAVCAWLFPLTFFGGTP